ncbi:uncharacterized protein LOC135678767 [Musa acuminata AAA Group]|uniref:uncharacterized protein LOC135643466 n=1 Tax=Musa acuminata AAA Group TaxID=214697 RepID=UPI0031D57A5B
MAVAMESFSIRDYATRMRCVDYDKCWPFAEERGGRSLPPMPVRRFRWWADELRAVRSDGVAHDQADPSKKAAVDDAAAAQQEPLVESAVVGRAGGGETSAEEREPKTPPPRAKQRTPKKRSILELFAVAPMIRGSQERDLHDGGGSKHQAEETAAAKSNLGVVDGEYPLETRKTKKRVKDGGKMLREKIGPKKKLKAKTKMMKKKKKLKVEIRAAKQEKPCKHRMSSPVELCKILKNQVYEKQFEKMDKKLVHNQTKPATIRTLLKKHIFRLVRTSKLASRKKEVHTNLKKRKRVTSAKKRKTIINTKGSDLVELCCESAKNLSFSGKDDTLAHDRSCLPLELPHLQTLCKIVSDVLAASSLSPSSMDNLNKRPSFTEEARLSFNDKEAHLNLNDKGVVTNNMNRGETSSGKQLDDSFNHLTTAKSSVTKRTHLAETLDLNHPVRDYVDLNCISPDGSTLTPTPTNSDDLKVLGTMNSVGLNLDPGTCQEHSFSLTSDHLNHLHNPIRNSAPVSDTRSALSLTGNQDKQHWISCLDQSYMDSVDGQGHLLGPTKDVCNGFPEFQPVYHIPKDIVISTCPSVISKTTVEPLPSLGSIWRDKDTGEGFIGLPLNSQGELIQLHPGNRYGICEVDKMPRSAFNSLQILPSSSHFRPESSHVRMKGKFPFVPSYHEDDQSWFLNQYYPARNVVISELGSVELQGVEKVKYRTYDDKARFNHCDPRQMEHFCCGCRDHVVTENCFGRMKFYSERDLELGIQPAIRPTMRLMGKNVTVGSCIKEYQGGNNGKVWSDEDIITTSCPTTRVYNRPILDRWHEEECIPQAESGASRKFPFNSLEVPSNYCCTSADKLTSNHMHLGFEPNWMLNDGNSSSREPDFHIDLCQNAVPCQSFLNRASHSAFHCTSESQSDELEQKKMLCESYPQKFCQHMLVNSTHCKHSKNVSYGIPSTYHPHINHVPSQTSTIHSLRKIPHWLLNTTNQHHPFIPYHPAAAYQSCTIPPYSGFPHASSYPRTVIPFPCGNSSSSQTYGSYTPMSVVYPSSISALPTNNFSSVSSTNRDNIKAKDGMGVYFAHYKSQDHSKRCRKRSAGKDDITMERVKRPNFKLREDTNAPTSVRREQLHGDQKDKASEVNVCTVRTMDDVLPVMDNEKDRVAVSGGSLPLKSSHTRSGPVKLSAGAKHILRPNGSFDQEKSLPIYSTVPFTHGTSAGKDDVLQEKAAKVYRF